MRAIAFFEKGRSFFNHSALDTISNVKIPIGLLTTNCILSNHWSQLKSPGYPLQHERERSNLDRQ